MNQITIGTRTFEVETETREGRAPMYLLRGQRGAVYGTSRFLNAPERMFLVNVRRGGAMVIDPIGPVVLTDADGELRLV